MDATTLDTPFGPFTVVAEGRTVYASGFTVDPGDLVTLIHPSLRPASLGAARPHRAVRGAVEAYVAGDVAAIDGVEVAQRGGPFLEHVWKVLREVPAGAPVTYTQLAARAGRPAAVRAAASGCARNAAALFVPCHRVLRTGGGLGGYRWGLAVKQALDDHEARHRPE